MILTDIRYALRYVEEPRLRKSSRWLATHDEELKTYRGKWILLEGDQLLAVDNDFHTVWLSV